MTASTSARVVVLQHSRKAVQRSRRFLKEIILAVLEKFCHVYLWSGAKYAKERCDDLRIFRGFLPLPRIESICGGLNRQDLPSVPSAFRILPLESAGALDWRGQIRQDAGSGTACCISGRGDIYRVVP
ncbi:MAG: hypothetical protein ACKPHU_37465 [Planctomycetaceae bacterium]